MADLTNLTDDELQEHIRDGILEVEARLDDRGEVRLLSRFKRLHGLLSDFEADVHDAGHISARSIGGDK